MTTKPKNLGDEIADRISQYNDEVEEEIQEEIRDTAKKTRNEIRENAPERTGEYKQGWSFRKTGRGANYKYTVYNREHWQLTHLLEYGHAARDGSRVPAYPHVEPAVKQYVEPITERIEQILKRAGD